MAKGKRAGRRSRKGGDHELRLATSVARVRESRQPKFSAPVHEYWTFVDRFANAPDYFGMVWLLDDRGHIVAFISVSSPLADPSLAPDGSYVSFGWLPSELHLLFTILRSGEPLQVTYYETTEFGGVASLGHR
jgi:hypothetical protein